MYAATSPFPLQVPATWQDPLLSAYEVLFGTRYRSPDHIMPTRRDRSIEEIQASIQIATYRRRFFITKEGRLGLGPSDTCVGDEVYLLRGGQSPFNLRDTAKPQILDPSLLRSESHNTQYYRIMGDCYVHWYNGWRSNGSVDGNDI